MTSLVFPDINVWLALVYAAHIHHVAARLWFESLGRDDELIFCRFTQLGLLRLLTTAAVMKENARTQRQAWSIYDRLIEDGNARLLPESLLVEQGFRRLASLDSASPQDWGDSYLAAFAEASGLRLVTFDKALASRSKGAVLLRTE